MITTRSTNPAESDRILAIAARESLFSPEDVACVRDLLADYFQREDHNGYFFLTAFDEAEVVGFACYGPTPLTHGTFDLYWISVDESRKGQGIGRILMGAVLAEIRHLDGRLIVLDTSGTPAFARTRAFYERLGFVRSGVVPHFYKPGDDLMIYTLPVTEGEP